MTEFSDKPVEPGFYQSEQQFGGVGGARLGGRKTGRTAPRSHVRQPDREATLQKHDLLPMNTNQVGSNANYDRNQGQLFDTESVTPRDSRSDIDVAKSRGAVTGEIKSKEGANPGIGAQPGFMPTLKTRTTRPLLTEADTAKRGLSTTQSSSAESLMTDTRVPSDRRQKIRAIHNTGRAMNSDTPFADMYTARKGQVTGAQAQGSKPDWYMGTDSSGEYNRNVNGAAGQLIQESAARSGTTFEQQSKAVAQTSPQMGWSSEGPTKDPLANVSEKNSPMAGTFSNLRVAESAVKEAKGRDQARPEDPRVPSVQSLGGLPDAVERAKNSITSTPETSQPYEVYDRKSQKAPNFNASLNLSHVDPAVQRVAAQSYTVDRHDAAALGVDADSKEFKSTGVYEAVAMTSSRAAHAAGELSPNAQSMVWEEHRKSKGLGAGNQMFNPGTTNVRPEMRPSVAAPPKSRSKRRGQYDPASDPDGPGF